MASQWTTISVDGQDTWAYLSLPEVPGPNPGVVVIQHGSGVDDFTQTMTKRLSEAGYAAIAPSLYSREDPNSGDTAGRFGRLKDSNIIKDVNAAIEHLSKHPAVRGDRIGITGFCLGGRVTYLMAGCNPLLRAAGVFYGGNTMAIWGEGPTPFDRTPNIACPVIGLFGEDDTNPSPDDVRKLDEELTKYGKVHEFHSYTGTGHSFQWQGNQAYRAEAAGDSWEKLLAWFQRYLRD
ncbi:MAG: hypothetical protein BZY88_12625 [SAR202 cluster bacterium Io17-Chloro-G9]|nr:MAG: hypothetical protein BZY88_12625 [SAR202 cluster bacterium Io17-Chloro-G9]